MHQQSEASITQPEAVTGALTHTQLLFSSCGAYSCVCASFARERVDGYYIESSLSGLVIVVRANYTPFEFRDGSKQHTHTHTHAKNTTYVR